MEHAFMLLEIVEKNGQTTEKELWRIITENNPAAVLENIKASGLGNALYIEDHQTNPPLTNYLIFDPETKRPVYRVVDYY